MSIAFTSTHACEQIARRTVRGFALSHTSETMRLIARIIDPIVAQVYSRGKVREGSLASICRAMVKHLREQEHIADITVETVVKPPSTHEAHQVRFVACAAGRDEARVEFVAVELFMTRREIVYSLMPCDFAISRHALSRFMLREKKPLKELFEQIIQPLSLSPILAAAVHIYNPSYIALPLGDGLLLGEVGYEESLPGEIAGVSTSVRPKTDPIVEDVPRVCITRDTRSFVLARTYIDGETLGVYKGRVRALLAAYEEKHGEGARNTFNALYFPNTSHTSKTADYLKRIRLEAASGANEMVAHPDWDYFERSHAE